MNKEIIEILEKGRIEKVDAVNQMYATVIKLAKENTDKFITKVWQKLIDEWKKRSNKDSEIRFSILYALPEGETRFFDENRSIAKKYNESLEKDKNKILAYIDMDFDTEVGRNKGECNYKLIIPEIVLNALKEDGISIWYNYLIEAIVIKNTVEEIDKIIEKHTLKKVLK